LISHCLIDSNMSNGNTDTTGGGGIALWNASPAITYCEFKKNTSTFGTAMVIWSSSNALIYNNHFHDNTGHGTINIGAGSVPILMNNLIENNTSTLHGVLHFSNASGRSLVINNTIVNNKCSGGAIYENDNNTYLFVNNILYGNTPAQAYFEAPTKSNFYYCLIEGGLEAFTGVAKFSGLYQNCIDSNPLCVGSNDFHLQDASPCINAGCDSTKFDTKWYYAPASDFSGNGRPDPKGSHPDIGAFESPLGSPLTGINEILEQLPDKIQLHQNYPNPFNPATNINYSISKNGHVKLAVYDLLGREVAVLVDETIAAGSHSLLFNASHIPSGVYIYRLETAREIQSKKLMLLK
jgi:hypothetical protein